MAQHEDHTAKRKNRLEQDKEKLFQLNVDKAFEALLITDSGRDFLWWLFEQTGINRNPFSPDAAVTGFNCGLLEVGQKVQERCIEVNPDGFLTMIKERTNGRRTADAGTDKRSADLTAADDPDAGEYADYEPDA